MCRGDAHNTQATAEEIACQNSKGRPVQLPEF